MFNGNRFLALQKTENLTPPQHQIGHSPSTFYQHDDVYSLSIKGLENTSRTFNY